MAETTNYDLVNKGFDVLLPGLVDYVTLELKDHYGPYDWWQRAVLDKFYDDQKRNLPTSGSFMELAHSLDLIATVRAMDLNWGPVFRTKLEPKMRTWAKELYDTRNAIAHRTMKDMEDEDAYRALDTMLRFAKGIEDYEAAEKLEQLRARTEKTVAPTAPVLTQEEEAKKATKAQKSLAETLAVGSLPSWRELVEPQEDVRSGKFKKAEFAADLSQVAKGKAERAYQDPVEFFSRTYLTEGLESLLVQGLSRVSGGDGEPVVQLKTAFGGGKTHSMIALYHLMKDGRDLLMDPRTQAMVAPLVKKAGATGLPQVHVACVVGTQLSTTNPTRPEGLGSMVYTMWGQIAAQLALSAGRPELFDIVKKADAKHRAPGAAALTELFDAVGPCMILLDEVVAYAKSLDNVDDSSFVSGTFDNFMTFIQQLTEAARNSPCTLLVASIPESDREVGDGNGLRALQQIEHTFGRMEAVWKPVTADEGFAIVSKRLFGPCVDEAERDRVCRAFAQLYQENPSVFPPKSRDFDYEKRLQACYPVHPEVYDRIYADWAPLPGFQRTRGVLRFMAIVIKQLWDWKDLSPLIMPGSLPLYNTMARDELTKYLPSGWDAVVDHEVDGDHSVAYQLDKNNNRYGQRMAGRRLARTIFLGSAPRERGRAGLDRAHVMLGALTPGDSEPTFADALSELKRQSQYLYDNEDATVFWYDTRPTLSKTVKEYEARVGDEAVAAELKKRMARAMTSVPPLRGVHLCPASSADVPDEQRARLVVLDVEHPYTRIPGDGCEDLARSVLLTRGENPRLYRNMLVFCACDQADSLRLKAAARTYLAWDQVSREKELLNFDLSQVREVNAGVAEAGRSLDAALREAYCWLLVPRGDANRPGEVELEAFSVNTGEGVVPGVVTKLQDEEALLGSWAPMLLKLELDDVLWRDREYVSVGEVWGAMSRYTYLTRLADFAVLRKTVLEGSRSKDFFGLAGGVEDGRFLGLTLGETRGDVHESDLLVRPAVAAAQIAAEPVGPGPGPGPDGNGDTPPVGPPTVQPPAPERVCSFSMTVPVNPDAVSKTVREVMSEIVENLTMDMGTQMTITLDVQGFNRDGFTTETVAAVKENARTLGLPVDFD